MSRACSVCPAPADGHAYCEEHYEPRCKSHEDVERDDQLRLSFVQELWALHAELGNAHMDQTLYSLERQIRERIERHGGSNG